MPRNLLSDHHKNWIDAGERVASPDFPALTLEIQGLGQTHSWLRELERSIIDGHLLDQTYPQYYKERFSDEQNSARHFLKEKDLQTTSYFAQYCVKSLFDVASIINNGRGVKRPDAFRKSLHEFVKTLNKIRTPGKASG